MKQLLTRLFQVFLLTAILSPAAYAQKKGDPNVIGQTEDAVKIFNAQQAYNAGNYVKAVNLYKEVLKNKPNDANVLFHVGQVYFDMGSYEDAQEYLEKANTIDPKAATELLYYLARVHHMMGDVDKAKEEYQQFKTNLNSESKAKDYELDYLIQQCVTAKELVAHPVDVTVNNAGDMINSSYDDKAPSMTADGKTLVFTSRRPEGKSGQQVDKEGDFKYFDDIYTATWDEAKQNWSEAELIKGSVNTPDHDACTSISPDGKQIFIYRNNSTDARGGEIFVSRAQQSGKWGAPKNIGKPINSSYVELGACISSDGQRLFFVSERPKGGPDQKGYGQGDIWMSTKISKTEWGPPVNLGPDINTPMDEGGIFLHPDGKTLFFSSDGHNSMGGYDIFMTRFENGKWSKPVNVGYPINSVRDDKNFVLSTDNKTAYFDSNRPGGTGERDIYKVDMSRYPIMGGDEKQDTGPKVSILKGTVIISETGQGTEATVVVKDKESGQEVSRTTSSAEGEYFFTLPGDKKYIIEVEMKGYQKVSEEFLLPSDKKGTYTMVKHLLLNKEKK